MPYDRSDSLPRNIRPISGRWRRACSACCVRALVELQLVFAEREQCDFTELSLLARHALTSSGGRGGPGRRLLGARLQHLLVDEMQDTSTSQYELIELLTQSWDGHTPDGLPGRRSAAVDLPVPAGAGRAFHRTMRDGRLGELPLTQLQLTANFRSQQQPRGAVQPATSRWSFPTLTRTAARLPYTEAPRGAAAIGSRRGRRSGTQPSCRMRHDRHADGREVDERQRARGCAGRDAIVREWFGKSLPAIGAASAQGRCTGREPWRIAVLVRSRIISKLPS